MVRHSRQRKHGGGKFKSERQRRYMWAVAPAAARKWAHNLPTTKADWAGSKVKTKGKARAKAHARRRRR